MCTSILPGWDRIPISGDIDVHCSIPYLRHLAGSPQKIEALLQFGKTTWNGIEAARLTATATSPIPLTASRCHGMDAGHRLARQFRSARPPNARMRSRGVRRGRREQSRRRCTATDRGIKGAFWANYSNAVHVGLAGGEQAVRAKLPGMRIDSLDYGGLMIVATDSPLPEDTVENRQRFLEVHAALQPAFLSREETPEGKRPLLGYFYRERASVVP